MKQSLAVRYGAPVPRYTSYPTAPHFSAEVGADSYATWLSALPAEKPISLYMHIPFCDEMCWYCGCFTKIVKRYTPISAYLDTVLHESELVSAHMPTRMKVSHVHWGGGSPTMLKPEDWQRTMDRLHALFEINTDAELAVELDPRTTTREYVEALAKAGINRVSIGVQDFDAKVQKAINRIQPFETTSTVVGWLRDAGITAINLDLMYGLPHQDLDKIERMTALALDLQPTRIALFGYAHVPWMRAHQRLIDESVLPDAEARWAQAEVAANILTRAGYVRIGFDHFAHPDDPMAAAAESGELKRNFQGYTTDDTDTLIGLGASSIGTLPRGYVQNSASIREYQRLVGADTLPITRGLQVTDEDLLRRRVIEELMCHLRVDLPPLCEAFARPVEHFDSTLATFNEFVGDGLLKIEGRTLEVTALGRPLVRAIAAGFDTYLECGAAKHSSAV